MHLYRAACFSGPPIGWRLRQIVLAVSVVSCSTAGLMLGAASAEANGAATAGHERTLAAKARNHRELARTARHREIKRAKKSSGRAIAHAAQVLCPVDDLSIPENASSGLLIERWLAYGETLRVEPYADRIWAGIWFTGTNGPEGWTGTTAPALFPAPGVPKYSLIGRIGGGTYQYVSNVPRSFTNGTPGYLMKVRLRVNDDVPGNGSGAFRVFVRYPCTPA